MTRWLEAAKRTSDTGTKLTKPTEPNDGGGQAKVLSVVSVLSEATDPDPDGVARTPKAIEAIWSDAVRRAVNYRKAQKPPTCSVCCASDWTVSLTEPDGRKLHIPCWQDCKQI